VAAEAAIDVACTRARAGRKSAATASVEAATAKPDFDREPDQQHQAEVDRAEQGGEEAVDERAVDDDVDVVEAVSPPTAA
jgi:hypothetical protein